MVLPFIRNLSSLVLTGIVVDSLCITGFCIASTMPMAQIKHAMDFLLRRSVTQKVAKLREALDDDLVRNDAYSRLGR